MKKVSVIGLGKLGSCMAAVYASKGFEVVGVDLNQAYVDAINAIKPPVTEPQLGDNLLATTDTQKAVLESDATFIIVPTPTDETGGFTTKYVEKVCEEIGRALSKKESYHLVTLTSTVLPGSCDEKIIPVLEQHSGKVCGKDFGFCYSPEFIAIGSVIKNLLNPDFFLIGESDASAGDKLSEFYSAVCDNEAPVERMSIPSAELAKISLNAFVTTKITFANMIAEVADHIPGADAMRILETLGKDKRIGSLYIKPGLGFGGPCFPRDNVAFSYMAQSRGCDAPIPDVVHAYNEKMVDRIADLVSKNAKKGDFIGFLGIAYKTDTPVVEESHALKIAKKLIALGYKVAVHEPAGHEHVRNELPEDILHESMEDLLESSNVYFLGTPDKKFLALEHYLRGKQNKMVIDPWGILKDVPLGDSVTYVVFGKGL